MRQRNIIWIMCIVVGIFFLLFLSFSRVPTPAKYSSSCRTPECGFEKQTRVALEDTAILQTANALPTFTPLPTLTATPERWTSILTPIPTMTIRHLTGNFREHPSFRTATDVWLIGSVPSRDGLGQNGVFVYASPPDGGYAATLALITLGYENSAEGEKYSGVWIAPRNIGTIMITGVTGIDGIVSFTTSTGVIGTFDLATKQWLLQ